MVARHSPQRMRRRQDFLSAASRVLGERGISGASVRAVAGEAEVSAGSVLYYFDSFEELVAGAVEGALEEFFERRRRVSEQESDPVDRIRKTIEAGIPETVSDDLRIVYEASSVLREKLQYRPLMTLLLERQVGLYRGIIDLGVALGDFSLKMEAGAIASNLVALEDAYDLYLLDTDNRQRNRYLSNTMRFAELALDCELIKAPSA